MKTNLHNLKRAFFAMIMLLGVGVTAWGGDAYSPTNASEIIMLTKANIADQTYLTAGTDNWVTGKNYGNSLGVSSADYYNMSSSSRTLTIKLTNTQSFTVLVYNSTANRTYSVKVGSADAETVTHGGAGLEETTSFSTGTKGDVTIVLAGGGSSVYPVAIRVVKCSDEQGGDPECTTPTISWGTEPAGGEVGAADVTATVTTTPADATVTWTSSKPEVATVTNGTIHFVAAGTTTITAKFTGDGTTYCDEEVSVQKEITVTEPAAPIAALDYGTYTFVGGTSTAGSKCLGVVNNMYFGRSGGVQTINENGLQTKSSSFIAFKLEKSSVVSFDVVTTKPCTGTYEVKSLTLTQLEGIRDQQESGANATTYFSISGDALCSITKTTTAAGTYETDETITLEPGCYWFGNTAANDGFYIKNVKVAAPSVKYHIIYAKGDAAVTGTLPTQVDLAEGKTFVVKEKGDLAWTGHNFTGWNDGTADYAAGATYTMGAADVVLTAQWEEATPVYSGEKQLTRVKFSNGFDAFVKEGDHSVKAYYLGETEPTVVANSWTVSEKATAAVVDNKIVVTAEDGTTQDYAITLTKVDPYATYDEVITLDGSQAWVVGGGYNGASGKEYYAANKSCDEATNMRIAEGKNRINLFVGACSTIDLTVAAQRNLAVYKNGVVVEGLTNSGAKNATFTIPVNEENPCYITIVNTTDCGAGDLAFYNLTLKTFVTPAATPTFTTDLDATASFEEGADVTLTVEATTTDAGTLSYQWYKNDAVIVEATEASLVVKAEGNYKVVVTNTLSETNKATAISTVCAVTMTEKAGCNYVGTPEDGETWYTSAGNWTLYSADSNGRKGGSKFGENKNFDGATVPVLNDKRFLFVPAKDMTKVQVYATTGGSRTLSSVKVTNEVVEASASKPTYVDGGIEVATANVEEVSTHYVFTATGNFEAGKCYWFEFSNNVYSFRVCYTEALPKADEPVLNTLANEAACGTFTELKATEGAVSGYSYQWYKDAEAIAEATAYNYQPTEAGVYYCAVTNSQADRRDNTKNTNEATLSLKAATAITAHSSLNARGEVDAKVTLSVTATGEGTLAYAWYTCDDEAGANAAVIIGAEADSYEATIAAGTQYYKAVVTGECGDAELIFAVSEKVNVELQPVTKTTTWDWEKTTYQSGETKVTDMVLANIDGVTNDENFESDKIMFTGNWGAREETSTKHYMRATEVKMNFEVGGLLTVYFRGTANDKTATVVINGKQVGYTSGSSTPVASDAAPVYGETTISLSGSGGSVQVYKIVFRAADYTRDLSGKIGTICLPNDVKAGDFAGITFYEPIYLNYVGGTPDKIYFDEVAELEAGRGYIFIPETGATKLMAIYSGDAVGSALTATQEHPMQGTLGGIAPAASNELTGNFMIKDNMFWTCGEWCGLRENTAYIKANLIQTSGEMPAPTAGRHRIALQSNESDGANTTTAIDNLTEDGVVATAKKIMLNGVMYIQRGNQMFTLDGQLVK